ncbi:hypothetical protein EDD86DRAFT_201348 [Gorgonomyces haynaldii]|nr:hypothetical protein EDD86DRAFT_201348 [Gorgonomyces haynaldii]
MLPPGKKPVEQLTAPKSGEKPQEKGVEKLSVKLPPKWDEKELYKILDNIEHDNAHSFSKDTAQGLHLMRIMLPKHQQWQFMQEASQIRIMTLDIEGMSLPFVRGDGLVTGDFAPEEMLSIVRSSMARATWDARFELAEMYSHPDVNTSVTYSVQKGTWPVGPRDLITVNVIQEGDTLLYVSRSIPDKHSKTTGENGRTRASLLLAGWGFKKTEKGIECSYIFHIDPKGSIPSSLIKAVQTQTPQCIARVGQYLQEKGPLPFIVRTGTNAPKNVGLEKEECLEASVVLHTLAKQESSFVLALPQKFKDGFEISGESEAVVVCKVLPKDPQYKSIAHLVKFTILKDTKIRVVPSKGQTGVNVLIS